MFSKLLFSLSCIVLVSCESFSQKRNVEKSDSFNIRAKFFVQQKQYDSTLYEIEQALRYDPKNWAAYNNRAILKFKMGRPENEVVKDFKKALELKPNYEISLYSLANYYDEIGQYQKAIEACNNYTKMSHSNDFDSVASIDRLRQVCYQRVAESRKIVDGVSVLQARKFYDSINTALDEATPIEHRFLDKVARTMLLVYNKGDTSSIDVTTLRIGLDSALSANERKIDKIKRIREVDSSLGYKQIVLDYILSFDEVYKGLFKSYIDDLSTKDVSRIKQSSIGLQSPMKAIKQKELLFKQSKTDFKKKYGFYQE
jgi:tetratricopeptide (TPR) repeat protein